MYRAETFEIRPNYLIKCACCAGKREHTLDRTAIDLTPLFHKVCLLNKMMLLLCAISTSSISSTVPTSREMRVSVDVIIPNEW